MVIPRTGLPVLAELPQFVRRLPDRARPIVALDQTHRAYLRAVDEAVARLRGVEADLQALLTLEPLRDIRADLLRARHRLRFHSPRRKPGRFLPSGWL